MDRNRQYTFAGLGIAAVGAYFAVEASRAKQESKDPANAAVADTLAAKAKTHQTYAIVMVGGGLALAYYGGVYAGHQYALPAHE